MSDSARGPSDRTDPAKRHPGPGAAQFRTIFLAVFAAGVALLVVVGLLAAWGAKADRDRASGAQARVDREYKMTTGLVAAKGKCNATVGAAYRAAQPPLLARTATTDTAVEAVVNRCLVDTYGYTPKDIPAIEAIEGIRQHCYTVRC